MRKEFKNKETYINCWGTVNTEYGLRDKDFQINNKDTGWESSSFSFEKGVYDVIISTEEIESEKDNLEFKGIPRMSGTEEDNIFMEEIEDDFRRSYYLTNEKTVFNSELMNNKEEFYIYLIRH